MANRIVRFHLSGSTDEVVTPHPQADSEFALQQGAIVLRFEPATSASFRQSVVSALNAAQIEAPFVWGSSREVV